MKTSTRFLERQRKKTQIYCLPRSRVSSNETNISSISSRKKNILLLQISLTAPLLLDITIYCSQLAVQYRYNLIGTVASSCFHYLITHYRFFFLFRGLRKFLTRRLLCVKQHASMPICIYQSNDKNRTLLVYITHIFI